MDELQIMLDDAAKPENSMGGLITFGHYPLSTVLAPGKGGISALIGNAGATAYLRLTYFTTLAGVNFCSIIFDIIHGRKLNIPRANLIKVLRYYEEIVI